MSPSPWHTAWSMKLDMTLSLFFPQHMACTSLQNVCLISYIIIIIIVIHFFVYFWNQKVRSLKAGAQLIPGTITMHCVYLHFYTTISLKYEHFIAGFVWISMTFHVLTFYHRQNIWGFKKFNELNWISSNLKKPEYELLKWYLLKWFHVRLD